MKLNVEFFYYPITEYRDFGDPNNTNVQQTVADLTELGVMNTQYDLVFRVCPAVNGYWSYGVINLNFPGPSRATGFSHSDWPVGTGVVYPGHLPGINYGLTWIFVHEVQHAIDALYNANGHPEMYHGDVLWEFPVACGEHFDFQAKTNFRFRLPAGKAGNADFGLVSLKIYDVLGREVAVLLNEKLPAGMYEVTWNGLDDGGEAVVSGISFYTLQAGDFRKTGKMVLVR